MDNTKKILEEIWKSTRLLMKSHPWHGVPIGDSFPEVVTAYIEIVPTDTVKFEIEKNSGFLTIDRPQKYSNICPTPYGFIPQTLCSDSVAEFCREKTGRSDISGDDDPLDICVITEKTISHSDILLKAVPIGGFRMIDGNEADDKIIAVMNNDAIFADWKNIQDCTEDFLERLRHYFLTYKEPPYSEIRQTEITHIYDRDEAYEVIRRSNNDYMKKYFELDELLKNR